MKVNTFVSGNIGCPAIFPHQFHIPVSKPTLGTANHSLCPEKCPVKNTEYSADDNFGGGNIEVDDDHGAPGVMKSS